MDEDDQRRRGERFVALHQGPGLFVLPNPWDVGSARMLEHLGYEALGTTSAGHARSMGRADGQRTVSRDEAIWHATTIAEATTLPVSGDFERGYGDDPVEVAETVASAIAAGLSGCCIEDATGEPDNPIYDSNHAADRIEAAAASARATGFPFVLVARAENYLHGRPDLDDTIARLQSFESAGADAVYAPGLIDLADIRKVVASVGVPVNVLIGLPGQEWSLDDLEEAGVRRASVGSGFYRTAMASFQKSALSLLSDRRLGPQGPELMDMDELFSS